MEKKLIEPKKNQCSLADADLRCTLIASFMAIEICLKAVMFFLGISIIYDYATTKCIEKSASDKFFYNTFDIIGLLNILFSVGLVCLKYPFQGKMFACTNIMFSFMLLVDLACEVAFFKVIHCFNQTQTSVIIVRVVLVFLLVLTQYVNLFISCYTVRKENTKYMIAHVICVVLFAVALISFVVLNIIILTKLSSMKYTVPNK